MKPLKVFVILVMGGLANVSNGESELNKITTIVCDSLYGMKFCLV